VPEMFDFFAETEETFTMRMPIGRVIITEDWTRAQLKLHPALKLYRNEREKTVKAQYQGRTYFFTAYKRRAKDGEYETVYLVSNMDIPAKQQVAAYNMRWPVEKFIRTAKQKFGAMQCQALEIEKQHAHILAGCLAYAILETANIDKEAISVDELVNLIRDFYIADLIKLIENPVSKKKLNNNDSVAKLLQNQPCANVNTNDSVNSLNA
jgi:hypothetical protein